MREKTAESSPVEIVFTLPDCPIHHAPMKENTYWRAREAGAELYCSQCDGFYDYDGKRVLLKCDCGCGWKESII